MQFVAIFSMLTCMQGKKRMEKAKKQNSQNTEARSSLYNSVHKQWLSFWSNLNKNGLKWRSLCKLCPLRLTCDQKQKTAQLLPPLSTFPWCTTGLWITFGDTLILVGNWDLVPQNTKSFCSISQYLQLRYLYISGRYTWWWSSYLSLDSRWIKVSNKKNCARMKNVSALNWLSGQTAGTHY